MSVSRAGLKLAQAATAFGYDFRGKVALDIGSSTGGFTEYALSRGAKRVYAVEKGTNQMVEPLKFDERIILREKTDIFEHFLLFCKFSTICHQHIKMNYFDFSTY